MRSNLVALVIASLGLTACGGAATTTSRAPVTARAGSATSPPLNAKVTVSSAAGTPSTPEDALLARIDQLQKVEFLRGSNGRGLKRPRVTPTPFKLSDLPVVRLLAMPVLEDYKPMQKSPPGPTPKLGPIDPDIVITPQDPKEKIVAGQIRSIHIGFREVAARANHGVGLVQLSAIENLRRGPNVGGAKELTERCGESFTYDRWVPIRWSRVVEDDDALRVGVGDVVFDRVDCSIHTVQSVETKAAPLVPHGVLYGFLGCGESCQSRESLVIAMPHTNSAAAASLGGDPQEQIATFSLVEIPIEHGGGGSFVAAVNGFDIGGWYTALMGQPIPAGPRNEVLGVEVTQSVRDASPIAIAYVDAPEEAAVADSARPNVVGKLIDLANITIR